MTLDGRGPGGQEPDAAAAVRDHHEELTELAESDNPAGEIAEELLDAAAMEAEV